MARRFGVSLQPLACAYADVGVDIGVDNTTRGVLYEADTWHQGKLMGMGFGVTWRVGRVWM